jgi:hypothetical protein
LVISLIIAVLLQAIPDRVGGSAVRGAPFDKLRANVVHTLPLITRPTEHSGVTFGAATSVLLTGGGECLCSEALQKGAKMSKPPQKRVAEPSVVPQGGFNLQN